MVANRLRFVSMRPVAGEYLSLSTVSLSISSEGIAFCSISASFVADDDEEEEEEEAAAAAAAAAAFFFSACNSSLC